ncbi:MAG: hypothetical protein AAF961_16515, partial [Planctomycetota bacterium]
GVLNLNNNLLHLGNTKLSGSEVRVTGTLNADGRNIGVAADAVFADGGTIDFKTGDSGLSMLGRTLVQKGAWFAGSGTMRNGTPGHMTLADGVETNFVDLANDGLLDIGGSTGVATVHDFANETAGVLEIDIGGYLLGETYDHLIVGGAAFIDGTLGVNLLIDEFGPGDPLPAIGDEFIILTSFEGVSGEFADVPPTYAGGKEYGWEVLHNPHDVTIRLASIAVTNVPEPTAVALGAIAASVALLAKRGNRRAALKPRRAESGRQTA